MWQILKTQGCLEGEATWKVPETSRGLPCPPGIGASRAQTKKWLLPGVQSAQSTAVHGRRVAHLQDQRGLRGHQGLQLQVHAFAASDR